jgi:hypothetical protein
LLSLNLAPRMRTKILLSTFPSRSLPILNPLNPLSPLPAQSNSRIELAHLFRFSLAINYTTWISVLPSLHMAKSRMDKSCLCGLFLWCFNHEAESLKYAPQPVTARFLRAWWFRRLWFTSTRRLLSGRGDHFGFYFPTPPLHKIRDWEYITHRIEKL